MDGTQTVKILIVNNGTSPISFEKYEFPDNEKNMIQKTILDSINRLGKTASALLKYKDEFHVAEHTARKGPSKKYFLHQVKYTPFADKL